MPVLDRRPSPEQDDAHELMPAWLAAQVPRLYTAEHASDPTVYAKYFTPDSSWTWYLLEFDGRDRCFGYVTGLDAELGYFTLGELHDARGHLGLRVERDLWFEPAPLSSVRH